MTALHIDFETYSRIDLGESGVHKYAEHPSSGIHCMAYAFGEEPTEIVTREQNLALPDRVINHVKSGGLVYAHNAAFELTLWNYIGVKRHGWPELDPAQVRCTMAMAYAMALPGSLENSAAALGVPVRKDMVGKRIMLKLCQPTRDGIMLTPQDCPEDYQRMYDYCKQDVEVERHIHQRMLELSGPEQRVWEIDQRINNRGFHVDVAKIQQAIDLVDKETARLNSRMLDVTGGAVGSCTEVKLLGQWIALQGVTLPGVAKRDVLDALSGDLPPKVRQALELRKEAAKSSTAKLRAMLSRVSHGDRVRGAFQYHGAATGRWAHRGVQPGNLPRPRPDMHGAEIADVLAHLDDAGYVDTMYGPILDAVADTVRAMITAPEGKKLAVVDYSAIEARVLAWLAGEQSVLDVFAGSGQIYEHAASRIYQIPVDKVDKEQRQIGKVATLALGYGGGKGAFQTMATAYGVQVDDALAEKIKQAWRDGHPSIVSFWYDLERAAIESLHSDKAVVVKTQHTQIKFKKAGSFLFCQLPSGRALCYPYPEARLVATPWGEERTALTFMTSIASGAAKKGKIVTDSASAGNWQRVSTYGGSLAENVTQAVARDLLAYSLVKMWDCGLRPVLHVHDEIVVEIDSESEYDMILGIMTTAPSWATGLPLSAEGWTGFRYGKQ